MFIFYFDEKNIFFIKHLDLNLINIFYFAICRGFKKNFLFVFIMFPVLNMVVLYFNATFKLLNNGFLYITGAARLLWGDIAITLGIIIGFFLLKRIRNVFNVDELTNAYVKIFLGFVICFLIALLCTICELCAAFVEEYLWGHFLWNYENESFNYRGAICLKMSSVFFCIALVFYFFLYNHFLKIEYFIKETLYSKIQNFKKLIVVMSIFWTIFVRSGTRTYFSI